MNHGTVTSEQIRRFQDHLQREERSENTVKKYLRDIRRFAAFQKGEGVTKEGIIRYKTSLRESGYAISSINSMLAAVNAFLAFLNWKDCAVKLFPVQREAYCATEKELTRNEYVRLIRGARKKGDRRLSLLLQTICATGIRVSELRYITVESVSRGKTTVFLKGKTRQILIVGELKNKLLRYAQERKIGSGAIFVTRSGKPLDRTSIWREMKGICCLAGVSPQKVFPHNLRHLFARTFYSMDRDIAKLADILGHSSIQTTRIYLTSTEQECRSRMEHMRLLI